MQWLRSGFFPYWHDWQVAIPEGGSPLTPTGNVAMELSSDEHGVRCRIAAMCTAWIAGSMTLSIRVGRTTENTVLDLHSMQ
jgi:hypothetical protein